MSFCRVPRPKYLPLAQAEAAGWCEGFLRCLFFRRTWSFMKSTSQGLLNFPWKLSCLQVSFFFSIWACTCTALVDIPGGLVVSETLPWASHLVAPLGLVAPTVDVPSVTVCVPLSINIPGWGQLSWGSWPSWPRSLKGEGLGKELSTTAGGHRNPASHTS